MKKTFLAAAAVLAALFFVSCADDVAYDSHIDTVLYLEIPEVKATAYPGMNIVSWKPVAGANGYVLYAYENGVCIDSWTFAYNELRTSDTSNIKNGVERTYYVEAKSKSSTSTSRSVNTENAMSGGVTVKGILPPADTKSLELYAYENYGTKESPKGNADYVVSASNIRIARDASSKLGITMPVKAYLSYDIYYTRGNELETIGEKTPVSGSVTSAVNDVTIGKSTTITAPGVYRAVVVANAGNSLFGTSEQVVSEESVTVESLNVYNSSTTSGGTTTYNYYANISAVYKDTADGKTVSISFEGAKFTADDTPVPTEYYKVYRSVKGKYDYTAVSGAVTETAANENAFRVEDVVPDNTVDYTYTLVVTDGTRFAPVKNTSGNPSNTASVSAFVSTQSTTTVRGADANTDYINLTQDIEWTITLPLASSDDVTVTGVYILEKPLTDSTAPCAADFDKADAKNLTAQLKPLVDAPTYNTNGYTVTTEKHKDVNVYMLVTTAQADKKAGEWISDAVEIDVQPSVPSITAAATDEKGDKKVSITVEDEYSSSDYSYTLYRSNSEYNSDDAVWVELDANLGTGKKDYSKTYTDTVSVADSGSTTYVYKVVKTWGDKKAESNKWTVEVTESN
ncbi:MAG: hypothetical protein K2H09_04860 [Treponemataceae bacterium]|nr:hypothetical protein [Treponemataceae bacterium]